MFCIKGWMRTYTGKTQITSSAIIDPQLKLAIYDAKSKNSLGQQLTIGSWLAEKRTAKKRRSSLPNGWSINLKPGCLSRSNLGPLASRPLGLGFAAVSRHRHFLPAGI